MRQRKQPSRIDYHDTNTRRVIITAKTTTTVRLANDSPLLLPSLMQQQHHHHHHYTCKSRCTKTVFQYQSLMLPTTTKTSSSRRVTTMKFSIVFIIYSVIQRFLFLSILLRTSSTITTTTAYVIPTTTTTGRCALTTTTTTRTRTTHCNLYPPYYINRLSKNTKLSEIDRRRRELLSSQSNPDIILNDIDNQTESSSSSSSSFDSNNNLNTSNKNNNSNKNKNNNVGWIHGVTSKSGPLNEAVLTILHHPNNNNNNYQQYTLQDANELITIGAVWAKMETLSNDEILSLYDQNDSAQNDARYLYADLPKGWGSGSDDDDYYYSSDTGWANHQQQTENNSNEEMEDDLEAYIQTMSQQRYRRILTPSSITAGMDIRVYPQPKRFTTACHNIQSTNLLYEDTTFIVVDKPPMLPTQPDASNYIECCPSCVNTQLGPFYDILGNKVVRPLLCHRIDTCVGGVVVLSKDRNGQKVFHQYQRERQLRKMYYAVTTQPVPTGQHIHWMWAKQTSRRRVSNGSSSGGGSSSSSGPPCQLVRHTPPDSRRIARTYWNRCVLEVVNCVPIQIDPNKLPPVSEERNEVQQQQYYQSTIRLVTGRKHQVRAQLASLGCPIIHDTLYGPIAGYTFDDLETSEDELERQISQCRVPTQPIGLQAAGILFGGIKVRANTPWWG